MEGIGRFRSTVVDCPDPQGLGAFYSRLLGWPIIVEEDDWVVVSDGGSPDRLAFQLVRDYRPPTWPEGERPQQLHLDVQVDDLDQAEERVLELGATKAAVQPSEDGSFRGFLDPAGHPFCLTI
ncbi:VOC family protein [Nonomuraea sp. MCN248]|uniref:VOC family protein n=1 Tax=Nonomuraea corallina TaxID=2989783 RepID=A0ABT4S5J6_9ACTN|nr:VOC family protein [Nonomuraea corallina]MDA0632451.1 VOC family protein [Nonomuraea corallina]